MNVIQKTGLIGVWVADTFEQWWDQNLVFLKDTMRQTWKASQRAILCECGEKLRKDCLESWEPGCDLGNNERFVSVWKGK
mgnify:CR=1 FL=1